MSRPTVLFVAQFEPHPAPLFGAQLRIDALLRELMVDYRIIFACTSNRDERILQREWPLAEQLAEVITAPRDTDDPADDPHWGNAGALVRSLMPGRIPAMHRYRWSSRLVERLRNVLHREPIAGVWASRVASGEMARAAGATRIVVDVDDLEGQMLQERVRQSARYKRRALHRLHAHRMRAYERRLVHRFHGVVVCKAEDLALLGAGGSARRWVVGNGVALPRSADDVPQYRERRPSSPSILFVGALGYEPNARSVCWFVQEVLPSLRVAEPSLRVVVAGRGPVDARWLASLAPHRVDVLVSPAEVTPFYTDADVVIAPLIEGGGTSIKVLEALAHGAALVATPSAVRGLSVRDREHCVIAADATSFASACLELLRAPIEAQRLADAGRALVISDYSWRKSGAVARVAMRDAISPPEERSSLAVE